MKNLDKIKQRYCQETRATEHTHLRPHHPQEDEEGRVSLGRGILVMRQEFEVKDGRTSRMMC
ncbi:hypothetical protein E2C01_094074 [Portunus trituberculatus]|uniref:Uncharacterized protein n=1 Tax=Portunus trituberculatus TaxID=210409 RepID=A0A5B7K253_PORTR|nr:hypothetical protein [Portunus trituberculatus]